MCYQLTVEYAFLELMVENVKYTRCCLIINPHSNLVLLKFNEPRELLENLYQGV